MKRLYILMLGTILYLNYTNAQIPQSFQYQAVIRDVAGNPIVSQPVSIRISILQGSKSGPVAVAYQETHAAATNMMGLINLQIGKGTPFSGSLEDIDWSLGNYYLKVEVDLAGEGAYTEAGMNELLSVPYALYSGKAGTKPKVEIESFAEYPVDSALFEVKDRSGNTVFAVYEDGVEVIIDETLKGGRGGFAVGGRKLTKGGAVDDILKVTPDSVRIYTNNPSAKGGRGGFAVGGRGNTKESTADYLFISADSTRIYFEKNQVYNGGFAVGTKNSTSGSFYDFLRVTPDSTNVNILESAVDNIRSGFFVGKVGELKSTDKSFVNLTSKNSFIGEGAGRSNTSGTDNIFIGNQAGYSNTIGSRNMFIGLKAGYNNTNLGSQYGDDNLFIGHYAGFKNSNGYSNSFVGNGSGYNNTSGNFNAFLGNASGASNTTGINNTYVGIEAGHHNVTGIGNVYVGQSSGWNDTAGCYNVLVGCQAGYYSKRHSGNIYIGCQAGEYAQGCSNIYVGYHAGGGDYQHPEESVGNNNSSIGYFSGYRLSSGSQNTFLGCNSGTNTTTGTGNVYIGFYAGANNIKGLNNIFIGNMAGISDTCSNKLYIHSSGTSTPLIYGDFTNGSEKLVINGNLGVGTLAPGYKLQVGEAGDGTQACANAWNLLSDVRLKRDFQKPLDPVSMLSKLNGYFFYWAKGMDTTRQFGISAQEVKEVLPEIVSSDAQGILSVDYGKLSPLLIEAIKEQQQQIEELKAKANAYDALKKEVEELKSLLQIKP